LRAVPGSEPGSEASRAASPAALVEPLVGGAAVDRLSGAGVEPAGLAVVVDAAVPLDDGLDPVVRLGQVADLDVTRGPE
jgi:hypothetical protein